MCENGSNAPNGGGAINATIACVRASRVGLGGKRANDARAGRVLSSDVGQTSDGETFIRRRLIRFWCPHPPRRSRRAIATHGVNGIVCYFDQRIMIQTQTSRRAYLLRIAFALQLLYNSTAHENVILIKIGGSSITAKDQKETLNEENLQWFAETIADMISPVYLVNNKECAIHDDKPAVILVHGAGSFGHHTAKEFDLQGYHADAEPPARKANTMEGLARTRHSVQKLNQRLVQELLAVGVKAVGISPCFGSIRHLDQPLHKQQELAKMVQETLRAGLVPVLHGDACLYGSSAAILSGDTLVQMCSPLADKVVFLTDVDGVFSSDPKSNPLAELIPNIPVDEQGNLVLQSHLFHATESAHSHDVTGGLKVSQKQTRRRNKTTIFSNRYSSKFMYYYL